MGVAANYRVKIALPLAVRNWVNVNMSKELAVGVGSGPRGREWAEREVAGWEKLDPDVAPHRDVATTVVERIGATIPEGVTRAVLYQPPYDNPSVIDFNYAAVDEPVPVTAPPREQRADGSWVLRTPGLHHELHATPSGATAPAEELDVLFGRAVLTEQRFGFFRQLLDFIDFWSVGGRI
jgi:hypothetical protein